MKTLLDIQTQVQFKARDGSIELDSTEYLPVVNDMYRRMCAVAPWRELRRQGTLAAKTVADANAIVWDAAMPIFTDILSVEIQNPSIDSDTFGESVFGTDTFTSTVGDGTYKRIPPAPSEYEKNLASRKDSERVPRFYELYHDGTDNIVGLYPAPSTTSDPVRVTGIIEPDPLTSMSSQTVFLNRSADDAFEWLISAMIVQNAGTDAAYAQSMFQQGSSIISKLLGVDISPDEFKI